MCVTMNRVLVLLTTVMTAVEAAEQGHLNRNTPSRDRFNFFDAELLEALSHISNKNVVVSPVSVKSTLAMLMEGAAGATAEEIRAALRLPTARDETSRWYLQRISMRNQGDASSGTLILANKVLVSDSYRINNYYRNALVRGYNSDVENVRPEVFAWTINEWVRNKTKGLINQLTDESRLSPNPKVLIASAVYFRGRWKIPFLEDKTIVKCFRTSRNECVKAYMMSETGYYNYGYVDRIDAEVIRLPYEGDMYSLLVVLPAVGNDVSQLTRDMMHVSMDEVVSSLVREEVHVQIPRFTAEFTTDLAPPLQKVHVTKLFTSEADLSKVSDDASRGGLFVSNMLHSAKIVVNEEGTEAAAATGAEVVPLMGITSTSFVADRPFLFFVRDDVAGAVLFSGKVERPENAGPEKQVPLERRVERTQMTYQLKANQLNRPLTSQGTPANYNRYNLPTRQWNGNRERYGVPRDVRLFYNFNVPPGTHVRH